MGIWIRENMAVQDYFIEEYNLDMVPVILSKTACTITHWRL